VSPGLREHKTSSLRVCAWPNAFPKTCATRPARSSGLNRVIHARAMQRRSCGRCATKRTLQELPDPPAKAVR
jgi:hypothetical protein